MTTIAFEPPHEHRAAVREVVGRRPGRRRADEAVARLHAQILAADRPIELDHPAERAAGHDRVVDRGLGLAVELDLERRQLEDAIVAGERACEAGFELVGRDRRQEADPAEVHAEHRHLTAEKARQRAKHRPVAAEHDREVGCAVLGRLEPVARGVVRLEEQLDTRLVRHRPQALDRVRDVPRAAVRDHRRALN